MDHAIPGKVLPRLGFVVFCAAWSVMLTGCASVPPVGSGGNVLSKEGVAAEQINWPSGYKPKDATFFVHNEIEIAAPPQVVWDILIQAETWPKWYSGAQGVKVLGSADGVLRADSEFAWETMGLEFVSVVKEFEPPRRLSWESRKSLIQGYHAWLIVPTRTGSKVITDESQYGFLARMQWIFIPNKLEGLHDEWLAKIKEKAENR